MNTKTMEGLVGARTNMELIDTPMRVYKEARRRGDTGTMERAMGYIQDFESRAEEYKEKADEGMKADAEKARKEAEAEREKAIKRRREEREELEKKLEEDRNESNVTDTVAISEEGKVLLKNQMEAEERNMQDPNPEDSDLRVVPGRIDAGASGMDTDPAKGTVTYTKAGEAVSMERLDALTVSVSV